MKFIFIQDHGSLDAHVLAVHIRKFLKSIPYFTLMLRRKFTYPKQLMYVKSLLFLFTQSSTKLSESGINEESACKDEDDDDDNEDDDKMPTGQDIDPERLKAFNVGNEICQKISFNLGINVLSSFYGGIKSWRMYEVICIHPPRFKHINLCIPFIYLL